MGDGQTVNGQAIAIISVSAIMSFLAVLTVILRFVARAYAAHHYYLDDYLIVGALIFTLGVTINNIVGVAVAGIGEHEDLRTSGPYIGFPLAKDLAPQGKVMYALQILHTCAMPFIKASILAFYIRLFPTRRFKIAVNIVLAYVFCWWVSTLFVTIFQCHPISDNWGTEPTQLGGCIPNINTFYSTAAFLNVIGDVLVLALPVPVVARLHMPVKHRVALLSIFLSGALVVVAGIGRTVAYFKADYDNIDFSHWYYSLVIWSSAEPTLGVICACLPTLRPLLTRFPLDNLLNSVLSIFSTRSTLGKGGTNGARRISDDRQHLPSTIGNGFSTLNSDSQGGMFFKLPDPNGSSKENQTVAMELAERRTMRKGMPAKGILVQEDIDQESVQSARDKFSQTPFMP